MEHDITFILVYLSRAVRGLSIDHGSYIPVFERTLARTPKPRRTPNRHRGGPVRFCRGHLE